jgi:branched-chain amino acid aminotransferase
MTTALAAEIPLARQLSPSPVPAQERRRLLEAPGFGRIFTDHMVTVAWQRDRGWHDGQLLPYGPIPLDPATAVLHYAQQVFEGLKAYRQVNGAIVAFRPEANAARLNRSAARMAMPAFPEAAFIHAIDALVAEDHEWVPAEAGHSLYLRPYMIATEKGLAGGQPSSSFLFVLIASPAGPYITGGQKHSVSVWLEPELTRAAPGGTGAAKTAGNYAAGLAGQIRAREHGCDQVAWLDAAEHRFVEEMGVMNVFFVYGSGGDAKLVTPCLSGTLLPGVTRDTLLTLARDLGMRADEGRISVEEWQAGCESGQITEVFACGTAAVVTAVGTVRSSTGSWQVGGGGPGPVTIQLRDRLTGIHYGSLPDPHGWIHKITDSAPADRDCQRAANGGAGTR